MPRARVHGQDQGQSARSGSGSEVSGEESEVTTIPRARVQDQGLCRVTGQESKVRVIPRARVQGLEQGSRSGFKDQGQNSRVRAVPLARVRVKYRSRLSISIRGQQSKIMTIPRARVQGQE